MGGKKRAKDGGGHPGEAGRGGHGREAISADRPPGPGPEPGGGATRSPAPAARNEVVLVGRLSAVAEERELPSGDVIATWRLVVDRQPDGRAVPEGVRRTTVDTIDCVTWDERVRETAASFAAGDVLAVSGALRRRFWRGGAGAVSRCEVEVTQVDRLLTAEPSPAPAC